jgi:alpha-beta hydrolase superfamily lysophospholipase
MTMSRKFFGTRFAQVVPSAQVDAMYDQYIVPTPGKIYWDGLISAAGKIRWDNPDRAPLLLIGGGIDLIAQAKMTEALFKKHNRAPSKTELKIYPNRAHWTCLQEGWEEVADFALDWAAKNARGPSVRPLKAA